MIWINRIWKKRILSTHDSDMITILCNVWLKIANYILVRSNVKNFSFDRTCFGCQLFDIRRTANIGSKIESFCTPLVPTRVTCGKSDRARIETWEQVGQFLHGLLDSSGRVEEAEAGPTGQGEGRVHNPVIFQAALHAGQCRESLWKTTENEAVCCYLTGRRSVWAHAFEINRYRKRLASVQKCASLRVAFAYRSMSDITIDLIVEEQAAVYIEQSDDNKSCVRELGLGNAHSWSGKNCGNEMRWWPSGPTHSSSSSLDMDTLKGTCSGGVERSIHFATIALTPRTTHITHSLSVFDG